jgi:hypothetical protein
VAANGIQNSYNHPDNGMTLRDMTACGQVATRLNEVIIFRSTGPWSLRWIERNYPTKNFHVKGKSSDWGPQAGFVPYLGKYSKVGGDAAKEATGTAYNDDGLKHSYAKKTQLCLTADELRIQRNSISAGRTALTDMVKVERSEDYILYAQRSSDGARFAFRAVWASKEGHYKIFVFDKILPLRAQIFETPKPLEVMTSSEVGANNKPMTGDYDLMAVCPTWGNYGSRSVAAISKPGLDFGRGKIEPGQNFAANSNLDGALDNRLNTGLPGGMTSGPKPKPKTFGQQGFTAAQYGQVAASTPGMTTEHPDMGNLTPRILRCINELNLAMGQTGPFRRVHHNAESHRNVIFGGITGAEMAQGDAFPLTVFHPEGLRLQGYDPVHTLETLAEFKTYAALLHNAGYFVPRNWTWGMSIRDGFLPSR